MSYVGKQMKIMAIIGFVILCILAGVIAFVARLF
jgi:hypothetical protein